MPAKAGQQADQALDLMCVNCGAQIHVEQGQEIPDCPQCGGNDYEEQ